MASSAPDRWLLIAAAITQSSPTEASATSQQGSTTSAPSLPSTLGPAGFIGMTGQITLVDGDLDWHELPLPGDSIWAEALQSSNGAFFVRAKSAGFVRAESATDLSLWLWSEQSSWHEIKAPDDHLTTQLLASGPTGHQVLTVGPISDTPVLWLWDLDDDDQLQNPIEIAIEFAQPTTTLGHKYLRGTGVNKTEILAIRGQLVAVASYTEDFDLEQLLADRGVIRDGERFCELSSDSSGIFVEMSGSAETDRDCMVASDVRSEHQTPESLGISEDDYLKILGSGQLRTRTVVSVQNPGGLWSFVHEMPGLVQETSSNGQVIFVSTIDNHGQWRLTESNNGGVTEPWRLETTSGVVILGDTTSASSYVVEVGTGSITRFGTDGAIELGSIPRADRPDQHTQSPGANATAASLALPINQGTPSNADRATTRFLVTKDGEHWSLINTAADIGFPFGQIVVGDQQVMMITESADRGTMKIFVANMVD